MNDRSVHYVEGRRAKKYNQHWYNLNRPAKTDGHFIWSPGFKRWLKKMMKGAPAPSNARYRLWGPDANDKALELQKLGVPGDRIEFPSCRDCGQNVKLHRFGFCRFCYGDAFQMFMDDWLRGSPQEVEARCVYTECRPDTTTVVVSSLEELEKARGRDFSATLVGRCSQEHPQTVKHQEYDRIRRMIREHFHEALRVEDETNAAA